MEPLDLTEKCVETESLVSQKQKLLRQVKDLKSTLSRESSLRQSLEQSHETLLQRVQEMEVLVESERGEVKTLSALCNTLKADTVRAKEDCKVAYQNREQLQQHIVKLTKQLQQTAVGLKGADEEKKELSGGLNKLRGQYNILLQQLDQMDKILQEKQSVASLLEKENKNLQEGMLKAANQQAVTIAKYEEQLETQRSKLSSATFTAETAKRLEEGLKKESREKAQALHKCSELERQLRELNLRLDEVDRNDQLKDKSRGDEIKTLRDQLETLGHEKDRAVKDKASLLDEVNQAIDSMTEDRGRLEKDIQELQLELESRDREKNEYLQENRMLLQKISDLEESRTAQNHIEVTIQELADQKNKLAYDKGKLQNTVDELQQHLENMAQSNSDFAQIKRKSMSMETKLAKTESELNSCKITMSRLEHELRQAKTYGERKEADFKMAIKARDQALSDKDNLLKRIESTGDTARQKSQNLALNLASVKEENKKLTETVEHIMLSHCNLQRSIEELQMELGKRDAQKSQLEIRNTELKSKLHNSEQEKVEICEKLFNLESREETENVPLRSELEQYRKDNTRMAESLESLFISNKQLQTALEESQEQLEKQTLLLEKIRSARESDQKLSSQEVKHYEDRLENLKQQLQKERENSQKVTKKNNSVLNRDKEELNTKISELSKANNDLRHQVTELQHDLKTSKEKIVKQKHHIEHLGKIRQKMDDQLRHNDKLSEQMSEFEKIKNMYMKKNREQARTISSFMAQIAALQEEIKLLGQAQLDASTAWKDHEGLVRKGLPSKQINQKYKEAKSKEKQLDKLRQQAEMKLKEANNESLQISASLQDSRQWFQTKFDSLQAELEQSKKLQTEIKRENTESKLRAAAEVKQAEESTARANLVMQASRDAVRKLTSHAEKERGEMERQMEEIKQRLEFETARSLQKEIEHRELKEASLHYTEELAKQLAKYDSSIGYDSSTFNDTTY